MPLLCIRYLPVGGPTSNVFTFIGKDQKNGFIKHFPERNYDDVLDAWESLFKTKKLLDQNIQWAKLYKGGKWSGKHMLSAPPQILEEINSWDPSKDTKTPSSIVLGEFYNDEVMAQTTVPEIVDDLDISERWHKTEDFNVTVMPSKVKKGKKKKEVEVGA